VPGAADALQAPRHRLRALDLHDEVDSAHVDAELERRRGHEAGDPAGLQELLDLHPLLTGERAVVRPRELLAGELVQAEGEPLCEAAVVDEDDRRAVLAHELEDRRVDRGPDRPARGLDARAHLHPVRERGDGEVRGRAELAHVLERDDDLEVELLADPGVDQLDLPPGPGDEAADLRERALGRGEPDALERLLDDPLEALEREGKVGAALRPRDRVHLVEDHGLDPAEHLAGLRGEEEEERFWRRDEDVGRRPEHAPALLRGCVAGSHRDGELRAEAGERAPQVALDVVVERFQRRDVEEAEACARALVQPVDPDEEGGKGLARAGRRLDEDVPAACDRGPAELLGGRRAGEGALEPRPRRGREDVEGLHRARVPRSS
jgi:hypothetical protein